jgi:Flp pilus assembly pilin Flp
VEEEMTISNWIDYIRANAKRQEGQTMAEYGVVLALITLAVVAVIGTLGTTIQTKLQAVVNAL